MFSKLKAHQIPLYAALLVLLITALALASAFYYLSPEGSTNYNVSIPDVNQNSKPLEYGSLPTMTNQNFYNQVKDKFLEEQGDFIEADLSAMKLTVYQGGKPAAQFPILTKGKPGSWWETPAGLYKVEVKEKNHFSSFAGVYLPWSLPFQGNFFIHGWPYYPNGTPVNSHYSGGCIRLSTEDAEKVFGMVKVGTPLLVYEQDFAGDNYQYKLKAGQFEGKGYLAADLKNNFAFAELESDTPLPIASLTKLMTALVAVEYVNIEKEITVTNSMIIPTSKQRLKVGQKISLYNLLPLLLEESSNEAAQAIASFLGPTRFVELMNQKAKAIGMEHTTFADASGRSDQNISTPHDLFQLAQYLYHNRSFILRMSKGEVDTHVYGPLDYADIKNFNGFADDPEFVGGKVGLTAAAGETIVSIFNIKAGEEERPVVIILLNSPDHFSEVREILAWIKQNYN